MPKILNQSLYDIVKQEADEKYDKPSAYKSMWIVKTYKRRGGTYSDDGKEKKLDRWRKEKWLNVASKDQYPVLRPSKRISEETPLTIDEIPKEELKRQIKQKQKIKGSSNLQPFIGRGSLSDKPLSLLNDKIVKTAYKFAVENKIKIIGSNSKRGLIFPSDFDFICDIPETHKPLALAEEFKKLFMNKSFMSSVLFMDFKCGLDERFYPYDEKYRDLYILRWTPEDVINGYTRLYDDKIKYLEECLKDDTIIKIDWIIPINGIFCECSMNIYYTQKPDTEKEKESIMEDIHFYLKTNTIKAMKRLYSLLEVSKEYSCLKKDLIKFFNSPIGYINKCKNDLELLQQIKEKYPKHPLLNDNYERVKNNLGNTEIDFKNIKSKSIINKLQDIINKESIKYLNILYNVSCNK